MSVLARSGLLASPSLARDEGAGLLPPDEAASARALLHGREAAALAGVLSAGVAIRLIQISQPFVDRWSFRQADVAMIARNFHRHGFNIFYPQIDWAGSAPGYVGTEFPLVPFLAASLYALFGEHEWIGRSVSVFFFAVSVPFLYLLVRKVSNERSALFAASIYTLTPLGIFSSRAFMPDMASLGLSMAALYFFAEWLDGERNVRLFAASCAAASLAVLVKLPAIIIGLPLAYLAIRAHGARFLRRPELWAWGAVTLAFPLAWYLHAHAVSVAYAPHHMFGEDGLGLAELGAYADTVSAVAITGLTLLVTVAMLAGLGVPTRSRFGGVFHWWLLAIMLFMLLAGRGSSLHPWYQLPLVPVAAVFAGRAVDLALTRVTRVGGARVAAVLGCLYLVAVAGVVAVHVHPLYEASAGPLRQAGREIDRLVPTEALVVFTEWDPTTVYYSRRKGWRLERTGLPWKVPRDTEEAIGALDALRARGARYLVFSRHSRWWFDRYAGFEQQLDFRYRRVLDSEDCTIFLLADVAQPAFPRPHDDHPGRVSVHAAAYHRSAVQLLDAVPGAVSAPAGRAG